MGEQWSQQTMLPLKIVDFIFLRHFAAFCNPSLVAKRSWLCKQAVLTGPMQ
jgi:hypothetical protein